jgi:hypothetical protein
MKFIRIEWIPIQLIKDRCHYKPNLTRHSYRLYSRTNKPHIHVIRNHRGELLLHSGIEAYYVMKTRNPKQIIPVQITDRPTISILEWTYLLFRSCLKENVNDHLKYTHLSLLLSETNHDIMKICHNTGCSKQDLYTIIFDGNIPEKYKELAIANNRIDIVNEIAKNMKLQNYRSLLYCAVFQKKNPLTFKKLKLFLTYLDSGYAININSIMALQNLNQIVDAKRALTYYWNHLQFPDTSIMEGIFYFKGDKNAKINVRI